MFTMGAVNLRLSGTFPSVRWAIVVVAVALTAAGCAQPVNDSGAVSSTSVSSTTQTVVSTTAAGTATTSVVSLTTTTTMADESSQVPPKPESEPDIELLPIQPQVIKVTIDPETSTSDYAELLAEYFSFERVSGYDSYTITSGLSYETADESGTNTMEGRVDGTTFYFAQTGDMREPYELIVSQDLESPDQESWIRVDGVWARAELDYLGLFTLSLILPDVTHAILFDTFDTLTFNDWDLIDGAWYARYAASAEFVAANLGYDRNPERLADAEGDVWISPKGFMHSYEISATDTRDDLFAESTWRLSDLGTTTIELPETSAAPAASAEPEASPAIEVLAELLASEFWDPTVLLAAEPFRWRGQTLVYFIDLDPGDNANYRESRSTFDRWGSVARGGIDRQRSFLARLDTGGAAEEIIYSGTWWLRRGTADEDGAFKPIDDWTTGQRAAVPSQAASGLLVEGYRLFNKYGTPTLELVGSDEIDGVPATRYQAVVEDGGDPFLRFDAIFDFWIESDVDVVRLLKLTFSSDSVKDMFTNGVVTGTENRVMNLELYDIGDDTIVINPP
ncbi:MAG: hypothetical protein BMS9Abin20_1198 [Acidimicrobiia bacterium]|nr:MAG: hypothetical protein BMS9Abin20_1198 [Acidimicrobiia bacterium]